MSKRSDSGISNKGNNSNIAPSDMYDAIHQYQQVSWESITTEQKDALSAYIDSNPDYTGFVARGMQVTQSDIDKWLNAGEVELNDMSSWSTDSSVAAQFSEVSRYADADNGMRSVILVSQSGLLNSAELPRTNSYTEREVLTKVQDYEIESSRVQPSYSGGSNKSPEITIIYVKPRKRK